MKIETLEHRHGGRILSLDSIKHERNGLRGRLAGYCWYFMGTIQWSDGSRSDAATIPPTMLCADKPEGNAELGHALHCLNQYLATRGAWEPCGWQPAPAYRNGGHAPMPEPEHA